MPNKEKNTYANLCFYRHISNLFFPKFLLALTFITACTSLRPKEQGAESVKATATPDAEIVSAQYLQERIALEEIEHYETLLAQATVPAAQETFAELLAEAQAVATTIAMPRVSPEQVTSLLTKEASRPTPTPYEVKTIATSAIRPTMSPGIQTILPEIGSQFISVHVRNWWWKEVDGNIITVFAGISSTSSGEFSSPAICIQNVTTVVGCDFYFQADDEIGSSIPTLTSSFSIIQHDADDDLLYLVQKDADDQFVNWWALDLVNYSMEIASNSPIVVEATAQPTSTPPIVTEATASP